MGREGLEGPPGTDGLPGKDGSRGVKVNTLSVALAPMTEKKNSLLGYFLSFI